MNCQSTAATSASAKQTCETRTHQYQHGSFQRHNTPEIGVAKQAGDVYAELHRVIWVHTAVCGGTSRSCRQQLYAQHASGLFLEWVRALICFGSPSLSSLRASRTKVQSCSLTCHQNIALPMCPVAVRPLPLKIRLHLPLSAIRAHCATTVPHTSSRFVIASTRSRHLLITYSTPAFARATLRNFHSGNPLWGCRSLSS